MITPIQRRPIRFPAAVLLVAVLTGCADPVPPYAAPVLALQDVPATESLFAQVPAVWGDAWSAACSKPGDRVVRIAARSRDCRSAMQPQAAAWAILTYDGVIEDLPELVINYTMRDVSGGQALAIRTYIRVPQRQGPAKLIAVTDPAVAQTMQQTLTRLGGTPLP